uniref:Uncharacterized protein n=1 Tax=Babesia bovis TaxID=5865 RepID=S6BN33_BABBO|nr:hypothetical protein [Babesia bovis]
MHPIANEWYIIGIDAQCYNSFYTNPYMCSFTHRSLGYRNRVLYHLCITQVIILWI